MSGFFDFQESLRPQTSPPGPLPSPPAPRKRSSLAKAPAETSLIGAAAPDGVAAVIIETPAVAAPLSITEFTRQIKSSLKAAFPTSVTLQGELSNYRGPASSGHHYFSLKDADALLNAVMFATAARGLKFKLTEGMEVVANGRLDLYEQGGKYNFIVTSIAPVGTGALELAFRQLHAKLEAEGLFTSERKKDIPAYPRTIALVTSRSAAGLADQLKVLSRFPFLRLIVVPVPVQGEGASVRIANALDALSHDGLALTGGTGVDLVLLGRGGGSYEDLFEFSREDLARAIARCTIPIITGIGHEVDTAIADLVADHHAHTPTEAATFATRFWKLAVDRLEAGGLKLRRDARNTLDRHKQRLSWCDRHPFLCRPEEIIARRHQRVDDREQKLTLALRNGLNQSRRRLDSLEARLRTHDPRRVLLARRDRVFKFEQRLTALFAARFRTLETRLTTQSTRLARRNPATRLPLLDQRLTTLTHRLARAMAHILQTRAALLTTAESQLRILGPDSILARGYTLTTLPDGTLLRSPADAPPGIKLTTQTAAGTVQSRVV